MSEEIRGFYFILFIFKEKPEEIVDGNPKKILKAGSNKSKLKYNS